MIPDFIPILGYADDAVVVVLVAQRVSPRLRRGPSGGLARERRWLRCPLPTDQTDCARARSPAN
ncbi:MAG TPA: DUF1232 domain-containing protein [Propionibacteriaceae bacterium]|nr:DUF1232 domain-containing protein [Propionibacteriaceae bacterium]